VPVVQLTTDTAANPLLTTYTNGFIVFQQGKDGDIADRKTGDGQLLANDVTLIRQMVVGSLVPDPNFNEFQRADTSPASTGGDGSLNATDVVQVRRYITGLDPIVPAAGPFTAIPGPIAPEQTRAVAPGSRAMRVVSATALAGDRVSITIEMDAQGDETASSFVLGFDPMKLTNPVVTLGAGVPADTVLTSNTETSANGRVAVLLDSANTFAREAGRQMVTVTFDVARTAPTGPTQVELTEGSISDANARPLASAFQAGTVDINGANSVGVEIAGRVVSPEGAGLRNAQVTITDASGASRMVVTSSFGYYTLSELAPGQTYTITVVSKRYRFVSRTIELTGNVADLDFIAQE
jgi:hypothetical protein